MAFGIARHRSPEGDAWVNKPSLAKTSLRESGADGWLSGQRFRPVSTAG